jgi:diketogulonate reductase-like aldo/keto reductase
MRIGHRTAQGVEYPHEIPTFGLGVFLMTEQGECKSACLAALAAGYTHIDTARAYSNEHEVGEALNEAGVVRENVFITTKLRRMHATGFEEVLEHCQKSLEYLQTDYIDLYLVHAPPEDSDHREPVWKGMEHCLEQGWVKAIGVSNYGAHHLDAMQKYATYLPAVNQIEINPWLQRPALRAATEAVAKVMAYSPLARGHKLEDPDLINVADRLGCTPAQVAIKFCHDLGCITISKSSRADRIAENLASLDVDISSEMGAIEAMECGYISGWDPTSEP